MRTLLKSLVMVAILTTLEANNSAAEVHFEVQWGEDNSIFTAIYHPAYGGFIPLVADTLVHPLPLPHASASVHGQWAREICDGTCHDRTVLLDMLTSGDVMVDETPNQLTITESIALGEMWGGELSPEPCGPSNELETSILMNGVLYVAGTPGDSALVWSDFAVNNSGPPLLLGGQSLSPFLLVDTADGSLYLSQYPAGVRVGVGDQVEFSWGLHADCLGAIAGTLKIGMNEVLGVSDENAPRAFDVRITPNPSRGHVALTYSLPVASSTKVDVLDAQGRAVLSKSLPIQGPGRHALSIGDEVPGGLRPGQYFLRVSGHGLTATTRFAVVH